MFTGMTSRRCQPGPAGNFPRTSPPTVAGSRAGRNQSPTRAHRKDTKRRTKRFHVRRRTVKKRLRAKLQEVRQTLLRRRHEPIPDQGRWLQGVVRGYYNYHAIPGNIAALEAFKREVTRAWLHALRRRSQSRRHRMPWKRFSRFAERWIPSTKILHLHPNERFYAKHPK